MGLAAYAAAQQPAQATKWAAMGAAALRGDGSATSDYTLASGTSCPASSCMSLAQLLAKAVPAAAAAPAATPLDVVYVVEQRVFAVGLPEGALSAPLDGPAPLVRLAVVKPGRGVRRWLRPPVGRHVNDASAAAAGRAGAELRVAGGVLALLQAVAATQPTASHRIQLCLQDTQPALVRTSLGLRIAAEKLSMLACMRRYLPP